MIRILAVGDEVREELFSPEDRPRPHLIMSCGDVPDDYLQSLEHSFRAPVVFVPGNHDPGRRRARVDRRDFVSPSGLRQQEAELPGLMAADGRLVDVAGVRIAGLGGSHRYSPGPHQYSQTYMHLRALRLEALTRLRGVRPDVLLTHSPPLGLGDDDDRAHQGFAAFHRLVRQLQPTFLVHGHIHPYGENRPDRIIGSTRVVNAVGYRMLEMEAEATT